MQCRLEKERLTPWSLKDPLECVGMQVRTQAVARQAAMNDFRGGAAISTACEMCQHVNVLAGPATSPCAPNSGAGAPIAGFRYTIPDTIRENHDGPRAVLSQAVGMVIVRVVMCDEVACCWRYGIEEALGSEPCNRADCWVPRASRRQLQRKADAIQLYLQT